MKKMTVYVSTNKVGSECSRSFKIYGDETEKELEELAQETMQDMIYMHFKVEDE